MKMIRTLALVVGVLGIAFVAGTPAVEAGGLPSPKEVSRTFHRRAMTHVNHVDRFADRATGSHDRYRRDQDRSRDYRSYRYRGYPRGVYPRSSYSTGYARPGYGYPVVVGGYRTNGSCNRRGYVNGYVGAPVIGFSVGVNSAPPVYRDGAQNDDRYSDEQYLDDQPNDDQLNDDQYSGDQESDDQPYDDQDSDDDYDE